MVSPQTSETMEIVPNKPLDPAVRAQMLSNETSVFLNVALFEQCQRVATMLSKSDYIPAGGEASFKGNVGNCMIALDLAARMNVHPIMLMQAMYVVKGRPGFEGKFLSALVNNSGRYKGKLKYEWKGEQGQPEWGCRAWAILKGTDERVDGPWVDWKMVVAEGWNKPKGGNKPGSKPQISKWETMSELMFMYRAASFFCNTHDSDLKMGMATKEELEDMQPDADLVRQPDGSFATGTEPDGRTAEDLYKPTQEAPNNADSKPDPSDSDTGTGGDRKTDDQQQDENKEGNNTTIGEWNPLTEDIKTRYFQDKKEILERVARERGLDIDQYVSKKDYKTIHQLIISSAEGVPMSEFEGGEGKSPEGPDLKTMDRYNELWINGNNMAKAYAADKMKIGSFRPQPVKDQIEKWLAYYDEFMAKQEKEQTDNESTNQDISGLRTASFNLKKKHPDLWQMGAKNKGIDHNKMAGDLTIEECQIMHAEVESLVKLQQSQGDSSGDQEKW